MTRLGLKILKFTKNYIKKNELPPTFVEIMEAVETKSRRSIQYAVDRLEEDQLIKRIPGRSRNIWPV
jgi:SOS-response transcriptional repressor LexA